MNICCNTTLLDLFGFEPTFSLYNCEKFPCSKRLRAGHPHKKVDTRNNTGNSLEFVPTGR